MEPLTHLDKIMADLEEVISTSPADFTELGWIERRVCRTTSSARSPAEVRLECTVLVRVREKGRFGFHRLDGKRPEALPDSIRQALAQARAHPVIPLKRPPEPAKLPPLPRDQLFHRSLAKLAPEDAKSLLAEALGRGERAELQWTEGRVAVLSSLGVRRRVRVTGATLFACSGHGPEAGVASASTRRLDSGFPGEVLELARSRRAQSALDTVSPEELAGPLVLSPEAAGALVAEVGRLVSAGLGHASASDLLEACFAPAGRSPLSIYDDGGDDAGMPFPFDLQGTAKRRLDLVRGGKALPLPMGWTSPPDQTGCFAAGGGEVQLSNLFLAPGESDLRGLLERAGDGIWISALRRLACHDPGRLRFRAQGRGLRKIRSGELGEALPDLPIDGTLPDFLGRAREVGEACLSRSLGEGVFGAVTAPALRLGAAGGPLS